MIITILGSGTSTGVPVIGCHCLTCTSADPKDKRLRTSIHILLEEADGISPDTAAWGILVDSSTDLRTQALNNNISQVNAVLYTHTHADHVNGIDDLRVFNFINRKPLPLYGSRETLERLESCFPYAFSIDPNYEGGAPPELVPQIITEGHTFHLGGVAITPIAIRHGKLPVTGYRIGNFAYLPDCNEIPDSSKKLLHGLEVLVLDGLRDQKHRTHFTQREAVAIIEELQPKYAYLTHMSHDIIHESRNKELREWSTVPVELAYDGLRIQL